MNAQTGSKSNIVVKTKEMKVSVAELREKFKSSDMRKDECERCAKLIRVKCAECMKNLKCDSFVRTQRERWTKPSSFSTQTEGGSRGRIVKAKVKGSTEETSIISNSNLNSNENSKSRPDRINFAEHPLKKLNISKIISSNTNIAYNFVGQEGSEKNNHSETNSNLNITPIKRKLLIAKQVSKLVPVFDCTNVLPVDLPRESNQESPAKRRKVDPGAEGGGGQHSLSQ